METQIDKFIATITIWADGGHQPPIDDIVASVFAYIGTGPYRPLGDDARVARPYTIEQLRQRMLWLVEYEGLQEDFLVTSLVLAVDRELARMTPQTNPGTPAMRQIPVGGSQEVTGVPARGKQSAHLWRELTAPIIDPDRLMHWAFYDVNGSIGETGDSIGNTRQYHVRSTTTPRCSRLMR